MPHDCPAVVLQGKCHVEPRQREAPQQQVNMAEFGPFGAQEFPAGRRVVEQVSNFHAGSSLDCMRFCCGNSPLAHLHHPSVRLGGMP
jgi:hypothetical protein